MLPTARTTTPARELTRSSRTTDPIARPAIRVADKAKYYAQMIYTVFGPAESPVNHLDRVGIEQTLIYGITRPAKQTGKVIAFTAASAGAGTSFILQEIGNELGCYDNKKTLIIEARKLQTVPQAELEKWLLLGPVANTNIAYLRTDEENITHAKSPATLSNEQKEAWAEQTKVLSPEDNLKLLKAHFDHILVDCQPARSSNEVMTLARLVDGVVIVAAAGKTRRDEIQRSQQLVEAAEGKILGFVLNKRNYPVPGWLYNRI